jgi:translocation and assembly module TamB
MLLAALVGVLGLALLGVGLFITNLEQPAIKAWLLAQVKERARLEVDFSGLELGLHGVRVRTLRVSSPPRFAAASDTFVSLEELEVRAQWWTLPLRGLVFDELRVGHIAFTLVRDATGATTLSELFPPAPGGAAASEAPAPPLSQALVKLPQVQLRALEIGAIDGRLIELGADGPARKTELSNLAVRGTLVSGPEGVLGTELHVTGAPLRVSCDDAAIAHTIGSAGNAVHAELHGEMSLRATEPAALITAAHWTLGAHDFALPEWLDSELLELSAALRFDAEAHKTTVTLDTLRALDPVLSATGRLELVDGEAPRTTVRGNIAFNLEAARERVILPGVSFAALKLDAHADELSLTANRWAGTFDWKGSGRDLQLDNESGLTRIDVLTHSGNGHFTGETGEVHAEAHVSAVAQPNAALADLGLVLDAKLEERESEPVVDAAVALTLDSARLTQPGGGAFRLQAATLRATARATLAELKARTVPALDVMSAAQRITAENPLSNLALERPSANLHISDLASDAAAPFGARGAAQFRLTLPAIAMSGPRNNSELPLSIRDVAIDGALPVSLATADGRLTVGSVQAPQRSARGIMLDVDLRSPLAWVDPKRGEPELRVVGEANFSERTHHGRIEALRLLAHRPEADHYALELDAKGSSLVVAGEPLPGPIALRLRTDAALATGTLGASLALDGAGGANAALDLRASFDRAERLHYDAVLSGHKLNGFLAPFAHKAPGAAALRLEQGRVRVEAHGDFAGVLRASAGSMLPAPSPNPLTTARGSQSLELAVTGIDYRAPNRALTLPELTLRLESEHGDAGRGEAKLNVQAPVLRVEDGTRALEIRGVAQQLTAHFDHAPSAGAMLVEADLSLDSLSQSLVPQYPVRQLRLHGEAQIDRLKSIVLRQLSVENPGAGTTLSAAGALELRADRGAKNGKTIPSREAITLEGRLVQGLAPLTQLAGGALAKGSLELPFRLESGGLLGYRFLGRLEAKQVSFATKDRSLSIQGLNGVVPLVEEFALLPSGPVLSTGPKSSPLSETRFFDVHPFLGTNNYVTAESIVFRGAPPLGPLAANVRIERSDFSIDQLQAGFRGGQIVGQVHAAYRGGDPIVSLRLNATGLRSDGKQPDSSRTERSDDVFDANAALTFLPAAMTLDGKMQIVRASREHLLGILDVLDPFHESINVNRVRQGLVLGYPKFVRFQLHDGAVDTKVELGGLAQFVRIDEIKAVPLGPILQKYVAPVLLTGPWKAKPDKPAPLATATGGNGG